MSDHQEQLDRATRDRLGKLRSMPVDLSRLEQKLANQLPPSQQVTMAKVSPMRSWLRLAAMVALFVGVVAASYVAFFGVGLLFGNLNALAMEPLGHIAGTGSAVVGLSASLGRFASSGGGGTSDQITHTRPSGAGSYTRSSSNDVPSIIRCCGGRGTTVARGP